MKRLFAVLILCLIPAQVGAIIIPTDEEASSEWALAGISLTGSIPSYSGTINVLDAPYNCSAAGSEGADQRSCIQAAINAAVDFQVVYIPGGEYRITGALTIYNKSIVVKGEADPAGISPLTRIFVDSGSNTMAFRIGQWRGHQWDCYNADYINSGTVKGSDTLNVASVNNQLQVGDRIIITGLDDTDLVTVGNCNWSKRYGDADCSGSSPHSTGQISEVTAINGNVLTIDPPMMVSYTSEQEPLYEMVSDPDYGDNETVWSGIEDLYVKRMQPQGGNTENGLIHIYNGAYNWIRGVEFDMSHGKALELKRAFRNEITGNYFHETWSYSSGGTGYGIYLAEYSSNNYIHDNIVRWYNIPYGHEAGQAGNVYAYNYMEAAELSEVYEWQMGDISNHCSHGQFTLFEGNLVGHITEEMIHGSTSHNTYFRNRVDSHQDTAPNPPDTNNITGFELDNGNMYGHVIANVIGSGPITTSYEGSNRSVYLVGSTYKETWTRHGNWDFYNDDIVWDPGIADHNLPDSFYLASAPPEFSDNGYVWPWITPDEGTQMYMLPAKERFDAGTPFLNVDQEGPLVITITAPTPSSTYDTRVTPIAIGGTASYESEISSVVWANSEASSSGTCTGTTTWTCEAQDLVEGDNTIRATVTAADASTEGDTLTVTYTIPDPPLITISTPTGSDTYDTSTTPITVGGSSSSGYTVESVVWTNTEAATGGTATGTTTWSDSVGFVAGTNTITATMTDSNAGTDSDVLTVTYTPAPAGTDVKSFGGGIFGSGLW